MLQRLSQINKIRRPTGGIAIAVLALIAIAFVLVGGILGLVTTQQQRLKQSEGREAALHLAEAGVSYYRWHLAHAPTDYTDGNGASSCTVCGPYTHVVADPYGGDTGRFSLTIEPPANGGAVTTITSEGWLTTQPTRKRSVRVRYGKQSYADYSFLLDAPVTFSVTSTTQGKIHSNGQIQFNGINQSTVTSAQTTNGVYSASPHPQAQQDLWSYPVPAFDFSAITIDLSNIKAQSQQSGGIYLPNLGGGSNRGYHLRFNSNGTMSVWRVTNTWNYDAWSPPDSAWITTSDDIRTETPYSTPTYSLSNINVIFAEDEVWVDGNLNKRITLASARFNVGTSQYTSIRIPADLRYTAYDGTAALGLIAQKHIRIPRNAPSTLRIDAILLAQTGGTYHYYFSGVQKTSLTIFGGIIAKLGSGFKYGNPPTTGYITTSYATDGNMLLNPPPYFPTTGAPVFLSWEELQ